MHLWKCCHRTTIADAPVPARRSREAIYLASMLVLIIVLLRLVQIFLQSFVIHSYSSSALEVIFDKDSYTVAENESQLQVIVFLSITGKFFYPVYASIELCNGTATGGFE